MSSQTQRGPLATAESFLLAVRRGEDPTEYERALASLDRRTLADALEPDGAARAFWLNVYNAAAQAALARSPSLYDSRRRFFGTDLVTVAGRDLSLDDVEHGLLRAGQWKFGLGYLPNPLTSAFARRFGVDRVDPRIHFALNCGAESCPAIAVYTAEDVDEQLALATRTYLETTVEYDPDRDVVRVPRHCLWYRGDFGGKRGVLALLREHGALPADARPRLSYADYDWALDVGNFRDPDA
jgi:hypothetical protein